MNAGTVYIMRHYAFRLKLLKNICHKTTNYMCVIQTCHKNIVYRSFEVF